MALEIIKRIIDQFNDSAQVNIIQSTAGQYLKVNFKGKIVKAQKVGQISTGKATVIKQGKKYYVVQPESATLLDIKQIESKKEQPRRRGEEITVRVAFIWEEVIEDENQNIPLVNPFYEERDDFILVEKADYLQSVIGIDLLTPAERLVYIADDNNKIIYQNTQTFLPDTSGPNAQTSYATLQAGISETPDPSNTRSLFVQTPSISRLVDQNDTMDISFTRDETIFGYTIFQNIGYQRAGGGGTQGATIGWRLDPHTGLIHQRVFQARTFTIGNVFTYSGCVLLSPLPPTGNYGVQGLARVDGADPETSLQAISFDGGTIPNVDPSVVYDPGGLSDPLYFAPPPLRIVDIISNAESTLIPNLTWSQELGGDVSIEIQDVPYSFTRVQNDLYLTDDTYDSSAVQYVDTIEFTDLIVGNFMTVIDPISFYLKFKAFGYYNITKGFPLSINGPGNPSGFNVFASIDVNYYEDITSIFELAPVDIEVKIHPKTVEVNQGKRQYYFSLVPNTPILFLEVALEENIDVKTEFINELVYIVVKMGNREHSNNPTIPSNRRYYKRLVYVYNEVNETVDLVDEEFSDTSDEFTPVAEITDSWRSEQYDSQRMVSDINNFFFGGGDFNDCRGNHHTSNSFSLDVNFASETVNLRYVDRNFLEEYIEGTEDSFHVYYWDNYQNSGPYPDRTEITDVDAEYLQAVFDFDIANYSGVPNGFQIINASSVVTIEEN